MEAKRIAIYSGEIPSTTFVERLIEGLAEKNHQIFLFGALKKVPEYRFKNIKILGYTGKASKFFLYFKYSLLLLLFQASSKRKLDNFLQRQGGNTKLQKIKYYPVLWSRPDVFHIQWAKSVPDWMWVQDFGIKLVVSLRGSHVNYSPIADLNLTQIYKDTFPLVDGFHAVSDAIGKEAMKYGASHDKIKIAYSGLELDQFFNANFGAGKENKVFKILSVGRAHWVKGYSYALDACKLLLDQGISFEYTIIGANGYEELVYQKSDLNLGESVKFVKNIPFFQVKEFMEKSDLVLMPSVEEGIANVVLEAMALGTLVLTADCGGMTEVVKEGSNGFVVPNRNPEAIAAKIIEIMGLPKEIKSKMLVQARKDIEQKNSKQQMVDSIEGLYESVL